MLPNSRIIPPNNHNHNHGNNANLSSHKSRSRSNSVINDSTLKKGFISRLLTNPKDQQPLPTSIPTALSTPVSTSQRLKYESVLGFQHKDDYATWGTPRSSSEHSKV